MFLKDFAVGLLIFMAVALFYGIFKGKVTEASPVIADGQLKTTADFVRCEREKRPGRIQVAVRIADPAIDQYRLTASLFGQAAICSDHFHHIGILRRVFLRMAT